MKLHPGNEQAGNSSSIVYVHSILIRIYRVVCIGSIVSGSTGCRNTRKHNIVETQYQGRIVAGEIF